MAGSLMVARYFGYNPYDIDNEKEVERWLELEYEDFIESHLGEDPSYYKEPYASWLRQGC